MIRWSLATAHAVEYRTLAVVGVAGSSERVSMKLSLNANVALLVTILLFFLTRVVRQWKAI